MSKRIKEVNGIKIIRRYGPGSIFSGLICLAICVLPVLMILLPWMSMTVLEGEVVKPIGGMTILDSIKELFNIPSTLKTAFFYNETIVSVFSWSKGIYSIYYISTSIIYMAIVAFDLIILFLGLEFLFRGKVKHFKLAFILSIFPLILILLLTGASLMVFIAARVKFGTTYDVVMLQDFIYAGISLFLTVSLGIIYATAFKNRVFIGDLGDLMYQHGENKNPNDNREVNVRYETKEIVKVKYEPAIGLPSSLSSIGGHAFSQNQNLVIAMIPDGIAKLGQGAFSNCGKLKIVSIPLSVKSIEMNCFWNCKNLQRINYAGSKEQWRHVKRGSNWLTKAGTYTVVCNDGPIIVNPYH